MIRKLTFTRFLLIVAGLYVTLIAAIFPLSKVVQNRFAENYQWQAEQAMNNDQLHKAEQILKRRLSAEDYDFTAQRLLAGVLLKANRHVEAAALLRSSVEKERAVSGRKVYNRGYDAHASRKMLSQALVTAGESEPAHRAAEEALVKLSLRGAGILDGNQQQPLYH